MNETPPINPGPQKRPMSLFRAFMIWVVLVVGVFMLFLGIVFWVPAKIMYQADEGFKRAQRTINPEELRQWALQIIPKHTNDYQIPASEIPNYIINLYSSRPEGADLGPASSDGKPTVVIIWGGGFFHWSLQIGDTNFSQPFVNGVPGSDCRYNFEWTNGIYYTRESGWKLW